MDDPRDRPRFAAILASLGETFNREITETLASIYFKAFAFWDIETFDRAVTQAILTCKFFPKPVELIELIEGTASDRTAEAEEAWRQVWKAVTQCGTYQSLFCEDRVAAECIRQVFGDWPAVGMTPRPDSDEGPMYRVRQKEFISAYLRLASKDGMYEPYLMGRIESENSPALLAEFGQCQMVTYLPTDGRPEAVELRALMPDHPLARLMDAKERRALESREEDDDGR